MKDVDAVADLSEVDDRTVVENAAGYPPQAETCKADEPAKDQRSAGLVQNDHRSVADPVMRQCQDGHIYRQANGEHDPDEDRASADTLRVGLRREREESAETQAVQVSDREGSGCE